MMVTYTSEGGNIARIRESLCKRNHKATVLEVITAVRSGERGSRGTTKGRGGTERDGEIATGLL